MTVLVEEKLRFSPRISSSKSFSIWFASPVSTVILQKREKKKRKNIVDFIFEEICDGANWDEVEIFSSNFLSPFYSISTEYRHSAEVGENNLKEKLN